MRLAITIILAGLTASAAMPTVTVSNFVALGSVTIGGVTTNAWPAGGGGAGSTTNVTGPNLAANSPGYFATGTPVYVESDPVYSASEWATNTAAAIIAAAGPGGGGGYAGPPVLGTCWRFEPANDCEVADRMPSGSDVLSTDSVTNYEGFRAYFHTPSTSTLTNFAYFTLSPPATGAVPFAVRSNQGGATVLITSADGAAAVTITAAVTSAATTYVTNLPVSATITNVKVTLIMSTTNALNLHWLGVR